MIKPKRIQTPAFPSHSKCKPYSPYDFQWSQAQNVVNFEFIPSTSPHPVGTIQPTISRAQPGTLNLAPRAPECSKHFVTALRGISGCSELPFLGSTEEQGGSSWGNWPPQVAPQRAGPAGSSDLAQPHRPQLPYALCSSLMGMVFHLSLSAWLGAISSLFKYHSKTIPA